MVGSGAQRLSIHEERWMWKRSRGTAGCDSFDHRLLFTLVSSFLEGPVHLRY